jgi:5-methylcytosine-specific restriction endonuclease McrBC regulatory subunit McrC
MITENTLDNPGNQIIKMAIRFILGTCFDQKIESKLYSYLTYFEGVSELSNLTHKHIESARKVPSSNPHYHTVIEYSLIILNELKLGYGDGSLEWHAFLANSNSLFEKFVSKILSSGTDYRISKWNEPKHFATLAKKGSNYGVKSFVPDVLVDYDEAVETCRAVFDVKNKFINPNSSDISSQISSADIYQVLFYCNQLNCKLGGIIYPSDEDISEFKMQLFNRYDLTLFILFVPMNLSLVEKIKSLCAQVIRSMDYH